eukprot:1602441-Rhodomonas_salina.2
MSYTIYYDVSGTEIGQLLYRPGSTYAISVPDTLSDRLHTLCQYRPPHAVPAYTLGQYRTWRRARVGG